MSPRYVGHPLESELYDIVWMKYWGQDEAAKARLIDLADLIVEGKDVKEEVATNTTGPSWKDDLDWTGSDQYPHELWRYND